MSRIAVLIMAFIVMPPVEAALLLVSRRTGVSSVSMEWSRGSLRLHRRSKVHHHTCCYATSASSASYTPSSLDTCETKVVHVPLVFVPGMKGSHLAFANDNDESDDGASSREVLGKMKKWKKRQRAWLTLGNLLNFPRRPDDYPFRDLSLPLTYDSEPLTENDKYYYASHYPRQHRGSLVPDGIVDHIVELSNYTANILGDLNFLPFYGHATRMLRDIDNAYYSRLRDDKKSTNIRDANDSDEDNGKTEGILKRVISWASWNNVTAIVKKRQQHHLTVHCRPTAVFAYDWRRPLPELCTELHRFCEETFPNQPVQVVAHSLGGLMAFAAMREHPAKYSPGAVLVGVPFETGIQYFQDLHKGYFTELDRCRQFTPDKQFTMSSHWSFFPTTKDRLEDRFVDVTGSDVKFDPGKSGIGKKAEFQPKVEGENAYFEFYDPDEWERLDIGVFGPEYDDVLTDEQRLLYKEHMRKQMLAAKEWRRTILGEGREIVDDDSLNIPPIVAMASNAVPTINQILRRRRKLTTYTALTRKGRPQLNPYEYDYVNGRAVPGDGRIDFNKAFPPDFAPHKQVALDSPHAKQICWEEKGGSWGTIYREVVDQAERYLDLNEDKGQRAISDPVIAVMKGQ